MDMVEETMFKMREFISQRTGNRCMGLLPDAAIHLAHIKFIAALKNEQVENCEDL